MHSEFRMLKETNFTPKMIKHCISIVTVFLEKELTEFRGSAFCVNQMQEAAKVFQSDQRPSHVVVCDDRTLMVDYMA